MGREKNGQGTVGAAPYPETASLVSEHGIPSPSGNCSQQESQSEKGRDCKPIVQRRSRPHYKRRLSIVIGPNGPIRATGQVGRALESLIQVGSAGVTALEISTWALRLSHYVYVLRNKHGLVIDTIREPHGDVTDGQWHGRYVLRSAVTIREFAQ
jgi:hypothetical protein